MGKLILFYGLVFLASLFSVSCDCECGFEGPDVPTRHSDKGEITPFISNGENFEAHKYPWLTLIRMGGMRGKKCTAVLISKDHILTATRCLLVPKSKEIYPADQVEAFLGIHFSFYPHDAYLIKAIKILRGVGNKSSLGDIAVLTLKEPVTISKAIYPICLPTREEKILENHANLMVAGWGDGRAAFDFNPKQAILNYIEWKDCLSYWPSLAIDQVCAAGIESHASTCDGDYGGPLMFHDTGKKRWVLIGIASYDQEGTCGEKKKAPSVFTSATFHKLGIEKYAPGACYPGSSS